MGNALGEKITVCVLTYNHVNVIKSTLESILSQDISGYDILVSDDCSTDGTWEAVLDVARTHDKVRAVRSPRNLGMAGNANAAVQACTRPYLALLHHDDLYRSDMLERWGALIDRHLDIAFVFNAYLVRNGQRVDRAPFPTGRIDGQQLLENVLLPRWGSVVRGTAMIRRSAWQAVGGMRKQFGMLADVDLWMRLARRWAVGYVDEPLVTVRHDRPSYYPSEYLEGGWSWARQKHLYEIHAANRIERAEFLSMRGQLEWALFRARLSYETTKWLSYAVVRGRPEMIRTADEGTTAYGLPGVAAFRRILQVLSGRP
jgi:glycosyltransferase involved in cell wall biosynthesis